LRSLIGKPRRCSNAFFQEERNMLEEKRQKIRLIQQRKVNEKELADFKDLPQEIPLTLSIGHRVYAHITIPEEGVFLGTIAAVDPIEYTYRVVFDRQSLGSQTVCDYEIKSVSQAQTIPIKAYIQTYRPKVNVNSSLALTPSKLNAVLNSSQSLMTPNSNLNLGSTSFSNLVADDLNSLNMTNPNMTAALLFQSNIDPMLGVGSPFKLGNESMGELRSQFQTPQLHAANGNVGNGNGGLLGGYFISF
jgi:hypothetical protein